MYKIISNDKVIDVVKSPKFIRFLRFGHVALTDKTSAQGIVGSDNKTIYSFSPNIGKKLTVVTINEINDKEFERLSSLLGSGQKISADETALAKARRVKINALSSICKNKIVTGFTITLSDGNDASFRLTAEDQLNLIQIENQLMAGETSFVYHATNQPCRIFEKEDMYRIVKAFRKHVLYHTTYFNAAKQHINNLTDIGQINLFNYGTDISDSVESLVLKQILKNGGA